MIERQNRSKEYKNQKRMEEIEEKDKNKKPVRYAGFINKFKRYDRVV